MNAIAVFSKVKRYYR